MIRRRRLTLAALAVVPALAIGSLAVAQVGGGYEISWSAITGGGGTSSGSTYTVHGAIGQPFGGQASGGSYTVQSGFYGGGATRGHRLFLPFIASDKTAQ